MNDDRIREAREAAEKLGLDVELLELDPDDTVRMIAENDSLVMISAKSFGWYDIGGSRGMIPACEIDLPWLEAKVAAQQVECGYFGIGNEMGGVQMPLFLHLRLRVGSAETPVQVDISQADSEWVEQGMTHGIACVFPVRPDDRRAFIATGPMKRFERPTVVDPKTGRNDPCPCGSGRKFKRCHGG